MGRFLSRQSVVAVMLLWAWFAHPPTASGHDEGVRAEVSPSSVAAGGTVEVMATDLVPNQPVRVQLVTGSGQIDIGDGGTDDAGQLELRATIPESATPRYYEIHVTSASGVVAVGYIEVQGPAETEGRGDALTWPWLAALAVLFGATAALAGRRSRSRRARR